MMDDAAGMPPRLRPAQPCPDTCPFRLLSQYSPRLHCAGQIGRIDDD